MAESGRVRCNIGTFPSVTSQLGVDTQFFDRVAAIAAFRVGNVRTGTYSRPMVAHISHSS